MMPVDEEKRKRQRAACKRWRERHPERAKASTDSWRQRNKERVKATLAAWEERNKARRDARKKEWRDSNKERRQQWTRAWLESNVERNRETRRQWRINNPHKKLEYRIARKARKRNAGGHATFEQIQARIDLFGGMCSWCGETPYEHVDHVIALASGGTNWPANLRPACRRCNQRKHKRDWSKRKPIFP